MPYKCHYVLVILLLLPSVTDGYSANCRSDLLKNEIQKCTETVHDFEDTHKMTDGSRWLEPSVSKELNAKCDDAVDCLNLLEDCSFFDDDDILWLEDFCDSYEFLTGDFHECAVKIDRNHNDTCVQDYLVNSPYFMLSPSNRCKKLESDGECVKSVINVTCSSKFAINFQELLNRQMIRLKC